MTKPATDEQIAEMEERLPNCLCTSDFMRSLIARIHKEQEDRKQAENDADLFHDEMEQLREALKPFAAAEELARNQFGGKSVTLAVLLQVAHYFIEWPHLMRARALLEPKP